MPGWSAWRGGARGREGAPRATNGNGNGCPPPDQNESAAAGANKGGMQLLCQLEVPEMRRPWVHVMKADKRQHKMTKAPPLAAVIVAGWWRGHERPHKAR